MPGAGMIAMAIEATRQLCPADKHITKFHLSDIQFLNALRVPDGTDGTEMQLSLSASTQVRSANSEAYFFRLMSLDSEWTEHCRGTIRVEFDEPLAEDKHQNASEDMYLIRDACREEADVEQLYSSSADNGVDYGPLFQVLNDVHYNGQKRGQAAATLCTQMDAVNNPGKRSYTIHPAVLDGLFQLVFSALYNGGTVDFPAMVPTSVRSLSIHLGTSTSTEISKMEASCNSRFSGYRGTTSDVVATASDDSKALIIMEGYQSTFVSANMPTFQQQAAERQLLSHMHWQPDLAMMSSDKIKEMCETSSDSSLAVYLRTLSHKNPTMKILEISGAAEVDNIPCADALSSNGIPRWSQYAFAQGTTEATESTKNSLKTLHTSVDFIPLDIYGDVSKQGFEAEYYDLIIAPHVLNETENESSTLRNLRQLLNESGRLVLSISFKHDILGELTDAGFGIESVFRLTQPDKACEEDIVIARAATLQNGHSSPTTDLTIIIDQSAETQRFFAQSLQSEFQSQGLCKQISILDITTFASSPQSASQIEGPCISLLEYATPFWSRPSSTQFQAFKNLLAQKSELLWVVKSTEEAAETEFHAVDGLARVLRSEDPKRRIVRLKLDSSQDKQEKAAGTVSRVLQKMLTLPIQEMEPEYEERDRLLYINRVVQAPEMNKMMSNSLSSKREQEIVLGSGVELQARLENPGTANVIRLQEAPVVDEPLERDEVIVEVHAVGLTRRDYLIATGQFNDTRIFSECSGIVKCIGSNSKFHPGDRVMVATTNACATLLRCKESQVVAIPDGLSVADAAGLPISALAAFRSLTRTGELSEDSVVLVHHAASSLGQLCIQVAGSAGAKVIATAGTEEKREFLRKTYNIPSELVVSSKDPDLSRTILRALDGGRVDIAVTFMPPDVTDSSKVLSSFGHLIDLGLSGEATADATNYSLPKCVSKSAVEIVEMFNQRPKMVQKAFTEMLPLIQNGTIKPTTPQHVFAAAEIDKALEWFRSGENYGKVVVDLSPGQKVSAVVSNEPSSRFDPNATYVISGGFGGIGRTICRWIAERGARNLLILSRSGAKSDSSKALVKELEALGVRVEAPCCDITQHNSLQRVLDTVKQSMPPIKGCIQCSMVLRVSPPPLLNNTSTPPILTKRTRTPYSKT
jgi:NADPH:quinone reductase-like Zn-dependent oxidoreductase